jgi:hypothetical protein
MKIKIDTYFDISCCQCAKSRSTDYEQGMEVSKSKLSKLAYLEGWKCINGKTLCPVCVKKEK